MILNIPNILVLVRIVLIPLMMWLLLETKNENSAIHDSWLNYVAALIFVIASVTDFFDGYIARAWNQSTKIGSIIDPLADKMLILGAFLILVAIERADVWLIYIILVREFFIAGLREMASKDGISIPVSFLGKTKTVLQMIAIGFLIMEWDFGVELLYLATFVTIYSGYEYVKSYIKA